MFFVQSVQGNFNIIVFIVTTSEKGYFLLNSGLLLTKFSRIVFTTSNPPAFNPLFTLLSDVLSDCEKLKK